MYANSASVIFYASYIHATVAFELQVAFVYTSQRTVETMQGN